MKQKIIDLVIAAGVWFFVVTAMHELCHYLAVTWQGGEAYLTMRGFWAGYAEFTGIPYHSHELVIVYAAGGIGTAILLGLLWWRARMTPSLWDLNHEAVLGVLVAIQLGLGIGEIALADPIRGGQMFAIMSPLLVALFAIPVMIYYAVQIGKWLRK